MEELQEEIEGIEDYVQVSLFPPFYCLCQSITDHLYLSVERRCRHEQDLDFGS